MPQDNRISLQVSGMNCGSCVGKVESSLRKVKGVQGAQVNFADKTAYVEGTAAPETLMKALKKAGYEGHLQTSFGHVGASNHKAAAWLMLRSLPALVLGVWLMGVMHTLGMPGAPYSAFWFFINWLVLGAMLLAGSGIYRNFLRSLWRMTPDMYTLIGLGTGAAWGYSCVVLYAPGWVAPEARHFYYEAGLFILAFINMGRGFEVYVQGRASRAVGQLMALMPQKAVRLRNGQEEEIPLEDVGVGDLIRVKPGDTVPVDGVIEEGESNLGEAMITGEPIAVYKQVGDEVIGGTENRHGSFTMRAQGVGQETVLARIVDMVRQAQATKPGVARLVDKIAGFFTGGVLLLAAFSGGMWWLYGPEPPLLYTFSVVMTVLVIACPCALGLATPVSIMAGVGRAARSGILLPKGAALQQFGLVDVVAFDKTGTLTKGRPRVVDVVSGEGQDTDRVIQVAASLANQSSHPLSEAIVRENTHKDIPLLKVAKFENKAGRGVVGKIGGKVCVLGNRACLEDEGYTPQEFLNEAETLVKQGKTVVFVARDDRVVGLLALSDELRPEAAETIRQLRKQGIEALMLTGDNPTAAGIIAKRVGIDHIQADQTPQEKQAHIKALQKEGKLVAMVGDGINDAPSLAQANVGVAIATGTDIAMSTADVVIAVDDLRRVPLAVKISRGTMANIKQNIFWAFVYNSVALPVAAGAFFPLTGVLLPPWVAGAAMAASSLTVVLNAVRLNWIRPLRAV